MCGDGVKPDGVVIEAPALEDDARKSPATTGQRLTAPLRALTGALLRAKVLPSLDRHPRFLRDGPNSIAMVEAFRKILSTSAERKISIVAGWQSGREQR